MCSRVLSACRESKRALTASSRAACSSKRVDCSSNRASAPLESIASALDAAGATYRILPGTASNFEYYSGVTFRVTANGNECISGGRYDGLTASVGGSSVPASGFAASLSQLAEVVTNGTAQ